MRDFYTPKSEIEENCELQAHITLTLKHGTEEEIFDALNEADFFSRIGRHKQLPATFHFER